MGLSIILCQIDIINLITEGITKMKLEIDVAEFAAQLKAGKGIGGKDGALTPLIKQLTEMALQAELETHLAQDLEQNRKNGVIPIELYFMVYNTLLFHYQKNYKY